ILRHGKILGNFLLLRYLKSYICNSVAELRFIKQQMKKHCRKDNTPIGAKTAKRANSGKIPQKIANIAYFKI
ncbi:MAG: hypothetical protein SO127_06155, partial [Muribaculaceae bacterium]|nr:hypothetical protein [Muribaculaceae bacterium]